MPGLAEAGRPEVAEPLEPWPMTDRKGGAPASAGLLECDGALLEAPPESGRGALR